MSNAARSVQNAVFACTVISPASAQASSFKHLQTAHLHRKPTWQTLLGYLDNPYNNLNRLPTPRRSYIAILPQPRRATYVIYAYFTAQLSRPVSRYHSTPRTITYST
ncbi:hypothetical protein FOBRF1_012153 [Fusarium oxysporum]